MSDLSLLPIALNLRVTRGTTRRLRLTFQDADGVAINISGATIRLTVKSAKSGTATVVYTVDASLTTPSSGIATVTIPKSATFGDTATVSRYYHEIRLIDTGAEETVWWAGIFDVYPTPAPV